MVTAIRLFLYYRHLDLLVLYILATDRLLAIVIHRHTILHLGAGDRDWAMIDDTIRLVIIHLFAAFAIGTLMERCLGQIQRLAGLTLGIQGCISFRRSLRNFIFDREEIYIIFTCIHIRIDDDTFLVVLRMGNTYRVELITVAYVVTEVDDDAVARQIIVVMHDLRDIVALELEYHLQVITEVVLTQTEAERFLRLDTTARNTTDKTYFGLVVDTNARKATSQREKTILLLRHRIQCTYITIPFKSMPLLNRLNGKGGIQRNEELEVTGSIRLVRRSAVLNDDTVEQEVHVSCRNSRVVIEHATGQKDRRNVLKVDILSNTMIQAEGNGCCSAACMVELELRSLTRRRDSVCISFAVKQAVQQIVTVLVGDYTLNGLAGTGTNSIYLDSRACRSILVTDISAYFTVRVTRTDGSLADGLDIPVALIGHR